MTEKIAEGSLKVRKPWRHAALRLTDDDPCFASKMSRIARLPSLNYNKPFRGKQVYNQTIQEGNTAPYSLFPRQGYIPTPKCRKPSYGFLNKPQGHDGYHAERQPVKVTIYLANPQVSVF